jgi:hypothetical protein
MTTDHPALPYEQLKHFFDLLSLSTVLATIIGWLPSVAALLSIIWTAIRIYETRTVQRWLGKHR